jgi:hypothetical protein
MWASIRNFFVSIFQPGTCGQDLVEAEWARSEQTIRIGHAAMRRVEFQANEDSRNGGSLFARAAYNTIRKSDWTQEWYGSSPHNWEGRPSREDVAQTSSLILYIWDEWASHLPEPAKSNVRKDLDEAVCSLVPFATNLEHAYRRSER